MTRGKKPTNEEINALLNLKNIKMMDSYVTYKTAINFQCLICNYIWKIQPRGLIYNNNGCPQCSKCLKLTNDIIDNRLMSRNIIRLDNYINNITSIKFKCLISNCQHIWKAKPSNILNNRRGCPKCANNIKFTNENINKKLIGKNIEKLDNYYNSQTKIKFKCSLCNFIWSVKPTHIFNSNSGCPLCNNTGKTERFIYNLLLNSDINFIYQFNIKQIDIKAPNYKLDFYFPLLKIGLEYNGRQHYEPVDYGSLTKNEANIILNKQIKRDIYIKNFCLNNNIKLICIDGRFYKNSKLEKYLILLLKEINGVKNESPT